MTDQPSGLWEQLPLWRQEQSPYEMSPIFSMQEWDDVQAAAKERGVHWKSLVHDAAMDDLAR